MTYAARHGSEGTPPVDGHAQDLIDAAQEWVDDDPDHDTRVELGQVLARAKEGDHDRGRRPRGPVLRDARVRHRRAARRHRCRAATG